MVGCLDYVYRRRKLKVNASKIMILIIERDGMSQFSITLNGEELEAVKECRSLGVKFSKDGMGEVKFESRVLQERKIGTALKIDRVKNNDDRRICGVKK